MRNDEKLIVCGRWQTAVLGVLIGLALIGACLAVSSCYDIANWQTKTFYGLDCSRDKLQNGHCVPVKQGGADVQAAQP